jgi:hypothetical protein
MGPPVLEICAVADHLATPRPPSPNWGFCCGSSDRAPPAGPAPELIVASDPVRSPEGWSRSPGVSDIQTPGVPAACAAAKSDAVFPPAKTFSGRRQTACGAARARGADFAKDFSSGRGAVPISTPRAHRNPGVSAAHAWPKLETGVGADKKPPAAGESHATFTRVSAGFSKNLPNPTQGSFRVARSPNRAMIEWEPIPNRKELSPDAKGEPWPET